MVVFILITAGLLAFVGAVSWLLVYAIDKDTWSYDMNELWERFDSVKQLKK